MTCVVQVCGGVLVVCVAVHNDKFVCLITLFDYDCTIVLEFVEFCDVLRVLCCRMVVVVFGVNVCVGCLFDGLCEC